MKTTGTAGNRDGYGAVVTAVTGSTRQLRQVESSAADGTQASPPVEFGFGSTTTIDSLIVQWQAGFETVQTNVSTNQILTVTEPTSFFTEIGASASVADAGEGEGVAWGDYDGDGHQDLYVTNFGQANKLYSNDGDGTFTDVGGTTADAGNGTGTIWGDYDNDGDLDLYLVQYSSQANKLFRNDGGGSFTDVSAAPINDAGSGNSASWSDYDKDGDLDFYLANDSGGTNRLFNNNGSGTFTDVGGTTGTSDNGYDVAWGDYDDDGDPDLYLSVSGGANKLFGNDGGTFTDVSASPVNDGGAGRGVAWADYDNDGDLDLYQAKTSAPNPNEFYRNDGGGVFTALTSSVLEDVANGHGIGWTDYNNDGNLDLFLANLGTPNRLFDNDGTGKFKPVEVGAGLPDGGNSRGTAFADYDGDGDMDLYVVNGTGTPNRLYRNNGNSNKWLRVDLKGTKSTSKGVGAKVEVVTGSNKQRRDVDGGSGYYSQPSLPVEFGTGLVATIDSLIVTWLSGGIQILTGVATNQSLTMTEFYASTPAAGLAGETKVGSGGEVQLFSIGINGGSPSSLTGIALTLADLSTATGLTAGEIAELRLYRSTNAVFDAGDTKIGTQAAVNLGSVTTVNPTVTETPASGTETFYIVTALIAATVTDGHAFKVDFAPLGVSYTQGGLGTGIAASDANKVTIDVVATQWVFTSEPTTATHLQELSPQPGVVAQDALGNRDFDVSGTVSLSVSPSGTLSQVNFTVAAGGAATGNVTISGAGTGRTLTASGSGLTGTSSSFDVEKATATITLNNQEAVFDGNPKAGGANTDPPGLEVIFTYNEFGMPLPGPPAGPGSFGITVTVSDDNYQGSVSGGLNIAPPPVTAGFSAAPTQGNPPLSVTFTDESSGIVLTWFLEPRADDNRSYEDRSQPVTVTYSKPGTYTVFLTVRGGGAQSQTSLDIIVNGPPDLAKIADATADEDHALVLDLSGIDADSGTWTLSGTDQTLIAASSIEGDKITFTPVPHANGSDVVRITRTNIYELTTSQDVTLTWVPVDDAPTIVELGFRYSAAEDNPIHVGGIANVTDLDSDVATLLWSGFGFDGVLVATATPSNNGVDLAPVVNAFGETEATIVVTDPATGATATQEVTLIWTRVNDVP